MNPKPYGLFPLSSRAIVPSFFHRRFPLPRSIAHRSSASPPRDRSAGRSSYWTLHRPVVASARTSNAEGEVIFLALDKRVKNVAQTHCLEHKGEHDLFEQLFKLLDLNVHKDASVRREIASCTGAI